MNPIALRDISRINISILNIRVQQQHQTSESKFGGLPRTRHGQLASSAINHHIMILFPSYQTRAFVISVSLSAVKPLLLLLSTAAMMKHKQGDRSARITRIYFLPHNAHFEALE